MIGFIQKKLLKFFIKKVEKENNYEKLFEKKFFIDLKNVYTKYNEIFNIDISNFFNEENINKLNKAYYLGKVDKVFNEMIETFSVKYDNYINAKKNINYIEEKNKQLPILKYQLKKLEEEINYYGKHNRIFNTSLLLNYKERLNETFLDHLSNGNAVQRDITFFMFDEIYGIKGYLDKHYGKEVSLGYVNMPISHKIILTYETQEFYRKNKVRVDRENDYKKGWFYRHNLEKVNKADIDNFRNIRNNILKIAPKIKKDIEKKLEELLPKKENLENIINGIEYNLKNLKIDKDSLNKNIYTSQGITDYINSSLVEINKNITSGKIHFEWLNGMIEMLTGTLNKSGDLKENFNNGILLIKLNQKNFLESELKYYRGIAEDINNKIKNYDNYKSLYKKEEELISLIKTFLLNNKRVLKSMGIYNDIEKTIFNYINLGELEVITMKTGILFYDTLIRKVFCLSDDGLVGNFNNGIINNFLHSFVKNFANRNLEEKLSKYL